MTQEQREQLERRLAELDSAVAALRRGFARVGQAPPAVCDLMLNERSEVVRLLNLDVALSESSSDLSWSDWKRP
jgi:hypothetical protein